MLALKSARLCKQGRVENALIRGLNASAKSIDPCQPAQSAQAYMDQNFSLSLNFLYLKRPFYIMIQSGCHTKWIFIDQ